MNRLHSFRWYRVLCGGHWHRTARGWHPVFAHEYFRQEIAPDPRVTEMEDNSGRATDLYAGAVIGTLLALVVIVAWAISA